MRIENSLNPNCSEAVIRFGSYVGCIDTSASDSVDKFVERARQEVRKWKESYEMSLKEAKQERLIAYDNLGGGADFDTLARVCYAVIEEVYKEKKIDLDKLWLEEKGKKVEITDGPVG